MIYRTLTHEIYCYAKEKKSCVYVVCVCFTTHNCIYTYLAAENVYYDEGLQNMHCAWVTFSWDWWHTFWSSRELSYIFYLLKKRLQECDLQALICVSAYMQERVCKLRWISLFFEIGSKTYLTLCLTHFSFLWIHACWRLTEHCLPYINTSYTTYLIP